MSIFLFFLSWNLRIGENLPQCADLRKNAQILSLPSQLSIKSLIQRKLQRNSEIFKLSLKHSAIKALCLISIKENKYHVQKTSSIITNIRNICCQTKQNANESGKAATILFLNSSCSSNLTPKSVVTTIFIIEINAPSSDSTSAHPANLSVVTGCWI